MTDFKQPGSPSHANLQGTEDSASGKMITACSEIVYEANF